MSLSNQPPLITVLGLLLSSLRAFCSALQEQTSHILGSGIYYGRKNEVHPMWMNKTEILSFLYYLNVDEKLDPENVESCYPNKPKM